jgi:3-hydroxyisobutyrate dehydrogenase
MAFIGLGNMGGGMAANLVKHGYARESAFDLSEDALAKAEAAGAVRAGSTAQAVAAPMPS